MPTYQYACTVCGHRLEAVQSFTDEPLTECPECAGRLRKQFSAVGVVFKGSGFYRTDSRSSTKAPASASKDGASTSSSSSETSSTTSSSSETSSTTSSSSSSSSSSAKPAAATSASSGSSAA